MAEQIARLIGGPGTGKTSELLSILGKVIDRGIDPFQIGFCSFTRAARAEAAERVESLFGFSAEKLQKTGWFRTVHSTCHRQLGKQVTGGLLTGTKEDNEWLTDACGTPCSMERASGAHDNKVSDVDEGPELTSHGSRAIRMWTVARNRLCSVQSVWDEEMACGAEPPSVEFCRGVIKRYEAAKFRDSRCDFTDLIGKFAGWQWDPEGSPKPAEPMGETPECLVWFFDEHQDASRLIHSAAMRLAESPSCIYAYFSGDPFQCQPAGTLVRTAEGDVPIEELDPKKHSIIAWNAKQGGFFGFRDRIPFKKAHRVVPGSSVIRFETESGRVTHATPNHRCYVSVRKSDKYCTYLMRQGQRWRVGTVRMFGKSQSGAEWRFGMRCNAEKADAGWILQTHDSDIEARAHENILSANYGITQVTFEMPGGNGSYLNCREFIDTVHEGIDDPTDRAMKCLRDHGRDPAYPIWKKGGGNRMRQQCFCFVRACNVLPGVMSLPAVGGSLSSEYRPRRKGAILNDDQAESIYQSSESTTALAKKHSVDPNLVSRVRNGTSYRWATQEGKKQDRKISHDPIISSSTLEHAEVMVYSLDVPRYGTYIADGFVTGNSLYEWAGADHHCMLEGLEGKLSKSRTMHQSWRCPPDVMGLGERVLSGCSDYFDREIRPADKEGAVHRHNSVRDIFESGKLHEDWIMQARTNYLASRIGRALTNNHVPWEFEKGSGGYLRPSIRELCAAFTDLQEGKPIEKKQWSAIVKKIPSGSGESALFRRGMKTSVAAGNVDFPDMVGMDQLIRCGATEVLASRIASGAWAGLVEGAEIFREVVKRFGREVAMEPRIRVGTCHAFKGSESTNVLLLTSLTKQVERGMRTQSGVDAERRVAYVGVTRAKRDLHILTQSRDRFRFDL